MVFRRRKQDLQPSANTSILWKNNAGSEPKSRKSSGLKSIVDFMTVQRQINIKDIRKRQQQQQQQQQIKPKQQAPITLDPVNSDESNHHYKNESLCWHFMHSVLNNDKLFIRCLALIFVIFLIIYILFMQLIPLLEKFLESAVVIGKWYSLGNITNSIFNGSIFRAFR